jgi:hypothetical protein
LEAQLTIETAARPAATTAMPVFTADTEFFTCGTFRGSNAAPTTIRHLWELTTRHRQQ